MQPEASSSQQRGAEATGTRAKLIRAAHELMGEKGIGATTIQEITDTADVGFGSLYNHFESRQAIVQAIFDETIESYGGALDHVADEVEYPAETWPLRSATW